MKSKKVPRELPNDLLSSSEAIEFLSDIRKLTVEDVIVIYAYAEAIVETVREPLIILDGKLRVKTANKAFFDTFDVSKQDTYNKFLFNLGNGQWNIPRLKKLLKEILPRNISFNDYEVTHEFEDIGKKTMVLNARRIVLEGHKTELILLAIEDITLRKEYENKLRESEQQYRWVLEQVKEHIFYTMDKEGLITTWNTAAEEVTGYNHTDVIGKYHGFLYSPQDQKKNVPAKELEEANRTGKAINERWHMRKDKSLFWGSGIVSPIRDDKNNLQGYSKVMRDITTRKEQEKQKDEFLGIASHELKTPLTSIKAYTQILKKKYKDSTDEKHSYFLTNIDEQTNKLVTLISDFLDISKIEAGKLSFTRKEFNLDALVNRIIDDFQYMTNKHTIKKVGVIKSRIVGDEDRIGQVINNLLTNAIRYSPQGEEIIVSTVQNKDSVTVSVQDFGIGIPKRKQAHIFEKYFQVSEKDKEAQKGFGLGLYISSEIIKRHKGQIWVESPPAGGEKGTTFCFTLPL